MAILGTPTLQSTDARNDRTPALGACDEYDGDDDHHVVNDTGESEEIAPLLLLRTSSVTDDVVLSISHLLKKRTMSMTILFSTSRRPAHQAQTLANAYEKLVTKGRGLWPVACKMPTVLVERTTNNNPVC